MKNVVCVVDGNQLWHVMHYNHSCQSKEWAQKWKFSKFNQITSYIKLMSLALWNSFENKNQLHVGISHQKWRIDPIILKFCEFAKWSPKNGLECSIFQAHNCSVLCSNGQGMKSNLDYMRPLNSRLQVFFVDEEEMF